MGSVNKLALGSLICGGVALALSPSPLIFFVASPTESDSIAVYIFWTWVGTTLGAAALGVAALSRPGVRSRERRGRTLARIGITLGLLQIPLYGLVVGLEFLYYLFYLAG